MSVGQREEKGRERNERHKEREQGVSSNNCLKYSSYSMAMCYIFLESIHAKATS